MINKKHSNSVGTKEENQYKKVFIVIQSFKINFLLQLIVRRVIILYLQSIIVTRVLLRKPYLTASSQAKSSYYYFFPI